MFICKENVRKEYFSLSHSHSSLSDIHYIVAELLALLDDVHIHRAHTVGIEMVIDIIEVLVAKLVAVVVDFRLDIERMRHGERVAVVGEHIVHLRQSLIHQLKHLMDVLILLVSEVLLVVLLALDGARDIEATVANALYL